MAKAGPMEGNWMINEEHRGRSVGVGEVQAHLAEILAEVSEGQEITITEGGVPVAMLVPVEASQAKDVGETIAKLRAFRKGKRLDGLKIKDMIEEGRE
jgi:prevent-host-death family protein